MSRDEVRQWIQRAVEQRDAADEAGASDVASQLISVFYRRGTRFEVATGIAANPASLISRGQRPANGRQPDVVAVGRR
jgi:hypothetical protein